MLSRLNFLQIPVVTAFLFLFLSACSAPGDLSNTPLATQSVNTKEANKTLIENYIAALGTQSYRPLAEKMHAENYVMIRQEFENLYDNATGDAMLMKDMKNVSDAFSNRTNTITRLLGENDLVAATFKITGTHSGNLFGIAPTGKSVEIDAAAVFKMKNGLIEEGFIMADEAGLLRQLNVKLPARQDGKIVISPKKGNIYTYDEKLAEHLQNPKDTPEFRHTRLLLSYKSLPENRPADYQFEGRPYTQYLRSGIVNIVERGAELGVEGSHTKSLSGRRDMISRVISDGDQAMMLFRLTAKNTGPLYGIPGSGNDLDDWELGFARFEGDDWIDGWWFKDELGYLLSIGNEEALNFLVRE